MRIDLLVHLRRGRHHIKFTLTMLAKSLTVTACVLGAGCDLGLGLVRFFVRSPPVAPITELNKEQTGNISTPGIR